jgi:hypothetical protein
VKTTLDTTHHGLSATVLARGTSGTAFTLCLRAVEAGAWVEVELSAEGLGRVLAAVLEQLDDEAVADLLVNELGPGVALELGQTVVAAAAARAQAMGLRTTSR